jgi:hypothetical protein
MHKTKDLIWAPQDHYRALVEWLGSMESLDPDGHYYQLRSMLAVGKR